VETPAEKPAPAEGGAPSAGGALKVSEADLAIQVKGVDDLLIYRAGCCNPIRGEAIIGYITRGKGIAVHSRNCPNVQRLFYEPERKIDVDWTRSAADAFPVKLIVHTADQPGLLNQLTSILSHENTNIRNLEARTDTESGDGAVIEMTVDVKDKKQLEKLINAMRRLSGVRDVERAS
jgi:GTP pyrophosphokinase